jgi:hypothetical protein
MPEEFSNKSAIWRQKIWHQRQITELQKHLFSIPVADEQSNVEKAEKGDYNNE